MVLIILWYLIGLICVIYLQYHHLKNGHDIFVSDILAGLVFSLLGPIFTGFCLYRHFEDKFYEKSIFDIKVIKGKKNESK